MKSSLLLIPLLPSFVLATRAEEIHWIALEGTCPFPARVPGDGDGPEKLRPADAVLGHSPS